MTSDHRLLMGMRGLPDYIQAEQEFQMKKQAAKRDDILAQATLAKAQQLDAGALGEQAFMKAAQGLELTPEELAAARLMDAKSGGLSSNPVTGEIYQKPRISDRIGLPGMKGSNIPQGMPSYSTPFAPSLSDMDGGNYDIRTKVSPEDLATAETNTPYPSGPLRMPQGMHGADDTNDLDIYEKTYQENLAAARGNPRMQQQITLDYMKGKADNQTKMRDQQDQFNRGVQIKVDALAAIDRALGKEIEGRPGNFENEDAVRSASGPIQSRIPAVTNKVADVRAEMDYVKNLLTVENLGLLKGVLSDTDMRILQSVGSGELGGSDARVISALKRMRQALSNDVQQFSPYISENPGTTPIMSGSDPMAASRTAVQNRVNQGFNNPNMTMPSPERALETEFKLRKNGFTPEQINEYMRTRGLK